MNVSQGGEKDYRKGPGGKSHRTYRTGYLCLHQQEGKDRLTQEEESSGIAVTLTSGIKLALVAESNLIKNNLITKTKLKKTSYSDGC